MPKNNVDQAPRIRSTGEKFLKGLNWGRAIRPHELETIFANCIDAKCFVQYKIMMFLTAQAEEDFGVALDTIMTRLNISKDAYYKNRSLLGEGLYDKNGVLVQEGKHWLSCEDIDGKSYITIHYDKIYADGKKQCTFLNYPLEECNCVNTTDESKSNNTTVIIKKEGYTNNYTDESNLQNITDECNCENSTDNKSTCENTTLKECNSQNTIESTCENSYESNCDNSHNNIREYDKEYDKAMKREEFDKTWGVNNFLTGAAAQF